MKDAVAEIAIHIADQRTFRDLSIINPKLAGYYMVTVLLYLARFDEREKLTGNKYRGRFVTEQRIHCMFYRLISGHMLPYSEIDNLQNDLVSTFKGVIPTKNDPRPTAYQTEQAQKKIKLWLGTAMELVAIERMVEKVESSFVGFNYALRNKTPTRRSEIKGKTLALAQETFDKLKAVSIPLELSAKPVIRDLLGRLDLVTSRLGSPLIPGKTRTDAPISRHLGEMLANLERQVRR